MTYLVSNNEFQESLKKISIPRSSDNQKKVEIVSKNESVDLNSKIANSYNWPMLVNLKVDGAFKKNTENVLNLIKTQNDQRFEIYPLSTLEMRKWMGTMNNNPSLAKLTFGFLLSNPEIKSMDFLTAELIKISKYVNFDKKIIIKLSEKYISEELPEVENVKELSLEDFGHYMKVRESALFLLNSQGDTQVGMELAAKKIMQKNKSPAIKTDVIGQLRYSYPNSSLVTNKSSL